jgi:hypothetical protein
VNGTDGKSVTFTMDNVYPGYLVNFGVDIRNCGTIPWNVTTVDIYYLNGTHIATLTLQSTFGIDFNDDGQYDIKVSYNDGFGQQIHNGQADELSWNIKVLEWAPQDASFGFTIVVHICAFNAISEVPT